MPPPGPGARSTAQDDHDPRESRLVELVRQYSKLIRHAVRSVVGRHGIADTEDIEQTVYLNLWQQVRREQTIDHPASYVYKAAVRETVRTLRRLGPVHLDAAALEPTMASPDPGPERDAARAEVRRLLGEALAELPEDRARAVRAHLQGLSVAEIMTMYGWKYQTARNLIARGMSDVRVALHRRGVA
jgi:RNA polymerase sigma factor (sigma-70 family)